MKYKHNRKMIRGVWIFCMIILVGFWNTSVFAKIGDFKPGSEPNGFRGIKWGTDISTLPDMEEISPDPDPGYGGIKVYTRKNENLHIGAAKLERIEYNFWRGKFHSVWVTTKGYVNWTGLKNAVFEKFGKGYQPCKPIEMYSWFGDITDMFLHYNEISDEGFLEMMYTYDKQPETGF